MKRMGDTQRQKGQRPCSDRPKRVTNLLPPLSTQIKQALAKRMRVRSHGSRFRQMTMHRKLPDMHIRHSNVQLLQNQRLVQFH